MLDFLRRLYLTLYPTAVPRSTAPLHFGILGAANIAPLALILPARTHPDVTVAAVAARDKVRANKYAKKHSIPKAYGGAGAYQALLDDPEIDVVYNPLPNGLHYEWTMKALAAGKHVLLEKPSADTAAETRAMFALAARKGLVLMEAFHYRFHPAMRRAKAIVDSGEIGEVDHIHASLAVPRGIIPDGDIRFQHDLGGGSFMDMGCYTMSIARHLAGADPVRVTSANPTTASNDPKVDAGMHAELAFPNDVTAVLDAHFRLPPRWGFVPRLPEVFVRVVGDKGEMRYAMFPGAHWYHSIDVTGEGGKKRTEKEYGIPGWTTYRYQLEAFVDRLRGRTPAHWFDAEDSIANMEWIERVYEASGLGVRPASVYVAS